MHFDFENEKMNQQVGILLISGKKDANLMNVLSPVHCEDVEI